MNAAALRHIELTTLERSLVVAQASPYTHSGKGREIVACIYYGIPSIDKPDGRPQILAPHVFHGSTNRAVKVLLNHNTGLCLADSGAGTMRLTETDKHAQIEISECSPLFERIATGMMNGTIHGMSFAGVILDDDYRTYQGQQVHLLQDVELREVSLMAGDGRRVGAFSSVTELRHDGRVVMSCKHG